MHQRVDHPLEFEEQGLLDTARQAARPHGQALARQRPWPGRLLRLILLLVLFRSALGASRCASSDGEVLIAKISSTAPAPSQRHQPPLQVNCFPSPALPVRATNAHWRRANADDWRCS